MAYDPRYVPLSEIQNIFMDKDSQRPAAYGKVYFYKDSARTTPKEVYHTHGGFSFEEYVPMGHIVELGASGTTIDDQGNDRAIYLKPYDDEGNEERYYYVAKNKDDVVITTREAVPSNINTTITPAPGETSAINLVKNGQFNVINPDIVLNTAYTVGSKLTQYSGGGNNWKFAISGPRTYDDNLILPGDIYYASNIGTTNTDSITIRTIDTGIAAAGVDGDASKYLYYASTPNNNETFKRVIVAFDRFNTLVNQTCTVSIQGFSEQLGAGAVVTLNIFIYDGTQWVSFVADSTVTLTSSFAKYYRQISLSGITAISRKYPILVSVNFAPNAACKIGFTNVDIAAGVVERPYPKEGSVYYSTLNRLGKIPAVQSCYSRIVSEISTSYLNNINIPDVYCNGIPGMNDRTIVYNSYTTALEWKRRTPLGSKIWPWLESENNIPNNQGWYKITGQLISTYKFAEFFYDKMQGAGYINSPGAMYGTGNSPYVETTFFSGPVYGIDVTNRHNGAPPQEASNSITGITVSRIQVGNSNQPYKYQIRVTATSGAGISDTGVLTVYTTLITGYASQTYLIKVIKNGIPNNSNITEAELYNTTTIPLYINDSDTQQLIAQKLAAVFHPLCYQLPDPRGLFFRVKDDESGVDPDTATRTPRVDGSDRASVGSKQGFSIEVHTHNINIPDNWNDPNGESTIRFTKDYSAKYLSATPLVTAGYGSYETRPKNIYGALVMKLI